MKKQAHDDEPNFAASSRPARALQPAYLGWFEHFNAGRYYEAHDVLEALWLRTSGPDHAFFKGLIQVAGAFVHLRKHYERPGHVVDSGRLRPAARLFQTARVLLAPSAPRHMQLDVAAVCSLCESLSAAIEASGFMTNPWEPTRAPRIELSE